MVEPSIGHGRRPLEERPCPLPISGYPLKLSPKDLRQIASIAELFLRGEVIL